MLIGDSQPCLGFLIKECACSPALARASYWRLKAPQLGWPTDFEAVGWITPVRFRTSLSTHSDLFQAFQGIVSFYLSKWARHLFDLPTFASSAIVITDLEPYVPQLPAAPHSPGIIWAAPDYLSHSVLFQHFVTSSLSRFSWLPPPACPPWP